MVKNYKKVNIYVGKKGNYENSKKWQIGELNENSFKDF